jgi:PAS domain S-box-containing protein
MGEAKAKAIVLVPMKIDQKVHGIIEIASFNEITDIQVKLLERVAENIAININTIQVNSRTAELLKNSQEQAQELEEKEEEMRQNFEELQATQEELERVKKKESQKAEKKIAQLEERIESLNEVINNFPGKVYVKDHEGKFVFANKAYLDFYRLNLNDILGKREAELFTSERAAKNEKDDINVIENGSITCYESIERDGQIRVFESRKLPMYIHQLGEKGLLALKLEISENMDLEHKLEQLTREMEKLRSKN